MKSRIGVVRFFDWVKSSHWVAALLIMIAVVFVRQKLGWRSGEIWLAMGLIGAWLVFGWIFGSLFHRPDSLTALSILDKRGGWKDRFSSAWAFLNDSRSGKGRGEQLHLSQTAKILPDALADLRKAIPLPSLKWAWVLPLLALLFALSPLFRPRLDAGDTLLTEEMQNAAAAQGEQLKSESDQVKNLDSLDEEEKKELEKLREEVDSVAEDLASTDGQTAMEVLEALESRARAAERLAEKLGLTTDAWASDEMLAEMGNHPDTADLALAIKDKKPNPAADESERLASALGNPDIARETEDRITTALERTMEKATEEDRGKPVGERVGNASRKMLDRQTRTAANEFSELAKHFRIVQDREDARKRLEELAAKLRDAGSEISGSKLQKMQKLAGVGQKKQPSPQGLKKLDANPLANQIQNMKAPQLPQPGQMGVTPQLGKNGAQKAPVPGAKGQQPGPGKGKGQQKGLMAPIPGSGEKKGGQGNGMAMTRPDGKGQKEGKGNGSLMAPVPGMSPGGTPVPGQGAPNTEGAGSSSGGQGGNEAGQGTAEMVENPTESLQATRDSKVAAQINKSGESTTRAVQGKARSEEAQRSRQEIMADFIAVEEQALDSQALPMSRRNHVLRYFSEIRNQFEKESEPQQRGE